MALHQDFKDLLSVLEEKQVRYLLIGGYAVSFHSRPRYTKDIDLWIAGDRENLARIHDALTVFGAPPNVLEALQSLQADEILFMGNPPVRVDFIQSIPGAEFATSFARRVDTDWEGIHVSVIGLEDLISAKRAAGRPQDLVDAEVLEGMRSNLLNTGNETKRTK